MESVSEQDKITQICVNLSAAEETERSFDLSLTTTDITGLEALAIKIINEVNVIALAGYDYKNLSFNETFPSGSIDGDVKCTNITIMEDNALEASETFIVTLKSSDSSVIIVTNISTVTIIDNDGMITKIISPQAYLVHLSLAEAAVSIPKMINVTEDDEMVQVCATLSVPENIERNLTITLKSMDETGK